jgi:hypothetical protein
MRVFSAWQFEDQKGRGESIAGTIVDARYFTTMHHRRGVFGASICSAVDTVRLRKKLVRFVFATPPVQVASTIVDAWAMK